jgi:hypothetical protein
MMARDDAQRRADTERLLAALRGDTEPVLLTELGELVSPGDTWSVLLTELRELFDLDASDMALIAQDPFFSDALWHEFLESQPEWGTLITPAVTRHTLHTEMPLLVVAYLAWASATNRVPNLDFLVCMLSDRMNTTLQEFIELMIGLRQISPAERMQIVDQMLQQPGIIIRPIYRR